MDAAQLTVEVVPIDSIRPYERNPRRIPQTAVDTLAALIKKHGWTQPIVVRHGILLQTRRALRSLVDIPSGL